MAEIFVKLYNRWALEYLKECNFSMGSFFILCIHVIQINLFKCVLFTVNNVFVESDLTCGTLSNWSEFLILSQSCQLVRVIK